MVPEGSIQTKDLTGQALPDATVNIIDLETGAIIATATTDANGTYQISVPPGGPYLLEAVKDEVKVQQITPQVEVGIEYDLGTADCMTTAAALIVQAMMDAGDNPADIDCTAIMADPNFDDVSNIVCSTGGDPTTSAAILQAVEDFLNPPAPAPTPTPTYTVTFDSNEGSAVSPITGIAYNATITLPTDPTRTGYIFGGWYKESGCTDDWIFATDTVTANITLYAQWTINTYTVTYDGNGNTSGAVPTDSNNYDYGATVTVLANTGILKKTGYNFDGWNTESGGSGTDRAESSTFNMASNNVTLYAKWVVTTIYIAAIPGVTVPVTGDTPVTTITPTEQYTGTVTWAPEDDTFQWKKVYVATITLIAKSGFTLTGVEANFFTVDGAVATNLLNSGVVRAIFPQWLAVGDNYGGGIVAYILQDNGIESDDPGYDANVQHGLIAAKTDQSGGIVWAKEAYQEKAVPDGTSTAYGEGENNTDNIIAQNGGVSTDYAAGRARDYRGGGHTDWFLPSQEELNKLWLNSGDIGGFVAIGYWSSSEDGAFDAWGQGFGGGSQASFGKFSSGFVRAVRAF